MKITLKDLSPGVAYVLQLRAKKGDAYGDWSKAFRVTTAAKVLAPATPTGFGWAVSGTSFLASWTAVTTNADGSTLNDFKTYRVSVTDGSTTVRYETTATRFDFTLEMNRAAFGTAKGNLSAFVQAVDLSDNASVASSTVSASNPAPAQPTGFTATGMQDQIALKWTAVTDDDLAGYALYMSTSGSGFTPGSGNLVWKGNATSINYQTFTYGTVHYFKLAAVDVFGTNSTYASASATPTSSFTVDTTAPATPTSITLTPTARTDDASLMDVLVGWTLPADTDLQDIQVRYRVNGSGANWQTKNVPADQVNTIIEKLLVGTTYEFQVRATDYTSNESSWTSSSTTSLSNSAPSKPAVPTLAGTMLAFAVSHNMQKDAGGQLESDVVALKVYYNTSNTFVGATAITTITVSKGSPVAVSNRIALPSTAGTSPWIFVTALDQAGLESTNSNGVQVTVANLDGTYIENATITSAKIASLAADKITAGTGIINDLDVKSKLTIGTGGKIQSNLFTTSSGTQGLYIDDDEFILKSGSIEAAALKIQNGSNLVPAQYAGFEFTSSFYVVRAASGSSATGQAITVDGASIGSISVVASSAQAKYESQSLQIVNSGGGARTVSLTGSTASYPQRLDTSKTYILSAFVYNDTGSTQSVTLGMQVFAGANTTVTQSIPTGAWTRLSVAIPAPATEYAYVYLTVPASSTMYLDAVQVEEQIGAISTPSMWKPPGTTSIDGAIIRTGQIQSASNVTVNGVSQPAWSINTQGGAQFGTANVRGSLVIGASGGTDLDAGQSTVQSSNWVNGVSGWRITSDGNAQFNNLDAYGSVRSTNYVEGTTGWAVTSDGNAQFQNMAVQETMGADTVTANTLMVPDWNDELKDFSNEILPNLARVVGFGSRGTTGPTINSASGAQDAAVMEFRMQCKAGYLYVIESSTFTMNFSAANMRARAWFKFTTNGTKPVSTSTSYLKSYDVNSGNTSGATNSSGKLSKIYMPSVDTDLWVLFGYSLAAGTGTVKMLSEPDLPGSQIEMYAYETGIAPDIGVDSTGSGSGSNPVQTYTKKYNASWSQSYRSGGTQRTDNAHLYQGYVDSFNGNQWAAIGFPYSTIASDLSGATIQSCKLTFKCLHTYYNAGASIKLGTHTFTSAPSTWNGTGQNDNRLAQTAKAGTAYTVELGTTIGNEFKTGSTSRGITIGPASATNTYYAYLGGVGEATPYLTITYRK